MNVILVGLTVIGLLAIWDSYLMSPITSILDKWVSRLSERLGHPFIQYFYDCNYCKGFWLCVIGALLIHNLWYAFPAYGIVVIGLSLQGDYQHEKEVSHK